MNKPGPTPNQLEHLRRFIAHYTKRVEKNQRVGSTEVCLPLEDLALMLMLATTTVNAAAFNAVKAEGELQ